MEVFQPRDIDVGMQWPHQEKNYTGSDVSEEKLGYRMRVVD